MVIALHFDPLGLRVCLYRLVCHELCGLIKDVSPVDSFCKQEPVVGRLGVIATSVPTLIIHKVSVSSVVDKVKGQAESVIVAQRVG